MTHLVAVATTDGKVVHTHFGHADRFHIVELDDEGYSFIETRLVDPSCRGQGHNTSSFDAVLAILHDCEAVVVGQIGPGAASYVINHGLRVFEGRGFVDEILSAIISEHLLDVQEKQSDIGEPTPATGTGNQRPSDQRPVSAIGTNDRRPAPVGE
ncbi:MAG: hypothetical protein LBU48_04445 [Coriobacteriales bacterium]|jgi:predicted Fe-Mo cluster-binding NifX family protein|nr:hypothetical protein [Coriobacteriales bacterium]